MRLLRFLCPILILAVALCAQEKGGKKGGGPFANPTNLKVLKADTLRQSMQAFTKSLGVQCTYCHVMGNFASDENPKKEVARMMISMARDINAKFPDGQPHVSCYTCHRGAEKPLMDAPAQ